MGLDVETPDPPDLTNRQPPSDVDPEAVSDGLSDLRRAELEELLRDGAWTEAFREWAEYTDLDEAAVRTLRERECFGEMDFYWDPSERRLRYEPPDVRAALSDRRDLASLAESELSDLADGVLETLADGYLDWDGETTDADEWRGAGFDDE